MSPQSIELAAGALPRDRGEPATGPGLAGHLNTLDIVLATLAYAGPLAGVAGYGPLVIGLGNGLGASCAFLSVMVVLLLFSIGYGALTRYVPNPGAFYAYITAGLGRPAGLGSAFLILASYFAIGLGITGFEGIASQQLVSSFGGPTLPWWIYSCDYALAIGALAYFHIAVSAKVLGVLLVLEVLVVAYFDILVFAHVGLAGLSFAPFTWHAYTSGHLGLAIIFSVALFSGFEATAIYREETRAPEKTIPRATILVVLFIGIFYAITCWALIMALGVDMAVSKAAADPEGVFFISALQFGGRMYYTITSILILTSIFAAHLAIQNVTTRYVYSLAVDGILPRTLGIAHRRHHSPHRASLTVSAIYAALTFISILAGLSAQVIMTWFAGLASFSVTCAMAVTSLATVFYFRRVSVDVPPWKTVHAPVAATVGLTVMIYLGAANFTTLISSSQQLADIMIAGTALTFVLGFVLGLWLREHRPDTYARIGRHSPPQ